MEDGLVHIKAHRQGTFQVVLILVVVEDGLVPEYDTYDDELKARS